MTDRSKFEQMLEYLISEEQEKAKEIFHQLVVEKSREIYEQILSEDFQTEESEEDEDEEKMESSHEDDEEQMEASDEEEGEEEGEDDGEVGGDATDDFMGDVDSEEDDEDGAEGEGDLEDRVMDLEDALDDLRSEFEMMMGGEEGDIGMGGDDMDMGGDDMGMGGDDMGMEKPVKDSFGLSDNFMREYIEKVSEPKHGDDGVNNKSIVAGKNDMGGTSANIAKSHVENGKGGTQGGLLNPSAKDMNTGNINRPGGNAGKTAFKKKEPGHGAEKAGAKETADKSADSVLNGAPKRAK